MSYRFMRLLVMFDLPTETLDEKRAYRKFRKFLISEGFLMHQFSIYTKLLLNDTQSKFMIERLQKQNPKKGTITILKITEKQFSRMIYLHGEQDNSLANTESRLIFLGEDSDEA